MITRDDQREGMTSAMSAFFTLFPEGKTRFKFSSRTVPVNPIISDDTSGPQEYVSISSLPPFNI